jgi:hypothetical protein
LENISLERGEFQCSLGLDGQGTLLHLGLDLPSLRNWLKKLAEQMESEEPLFSRVLLDGVSHFRGTLAISPFSLSCLDPVLPPPFRMQGQIRGEIQALDGPPVGDGELFMEPIRALPGLETLQNLELALHFQGARGIGGTARAQMGNGTLALEGQIYGNGSGFSCEIRGRGKNLPLLRRGNFYLDGDVDLLLKSSSQQTRLSGSIHLLEGRLYSDSFDLRSPLPSTAGAVARTHGKGWDNWKLDLSLDGERFFRIRTPYLRGLLSLHMDIGGTMAVPIVYGQVSTARAAILFPFARFEVQRGTLEFSPDPSPPLWSVFATSRLHGYDLQLDLSGRSRVPSPVFTSYPPLPSGDIVAMVMADRIPRNLSSEKSEAFLLPISSWSALGTYLGTGFLGEDFGRKVRVQMGQDVTESGQETVEVECKFDDNHSLILERDRFDHSAVDYRIRVFSK